MNNRVLLKGLAILIVLIICAVKLYPNLVWYSLPLEKRTEQAKRKDPLAKDVIPLGLDLQGGVHLVYQIDKSKLPDESDETITRAIEQNIVVINNRIDSLGVASPNVQRQGRDFILIQLPGVYESETARNIIGKTALLEFRLVKDDPALVKILDVIREKNVRPEDVANNRLPDEVKKLIPAGLVLMPAREGSYLLVNDKAELTGKYLKQARVEFGHGSDMVAASGLSIGFELDSDGAQIFEAFTASHINDRLAIVLDGIVYSAPRIETRIPGGQGQITGSFSAEEAKNLANVLNSGNLQAPMNVVEERTVGPELGEDSIRSGLRAIGIGFALIIVFVAVYYKFSGVMADVGMIMNLFVLMAVMNWIHATLTLPGIAGIILSLAMAVDANVIIMERIREELRKGKTVRAAVEEGYEKAFTAIFDGHVTSILAGAFLFQFGTGPVKGFGVTLIFGLLLSFVTAIWVTRYFYELLFAVAQPKTLSV